MNKRPQRQYTSAISKGAAMIEETRRLLEHWDPQESLNEFATRVQNQGLIGNATAYRTRDLVRRVFAPRYLKPDNKPAFILQKILSSRLSGRTFTEFIFLYSARQDQLIYDFTIREFWPSVRRNRNSIDSEVMNSFFAEAHYDGRLQKQWSESVSARVGRSVLGLLRDVGFLRESSRGRKEIVNYEMSDQGSALLARELHESGITDSSLCAHADWALFGMSESEVFERLSGLGEHRGVIVQRAGSVVHFTWTVNSIKELIDVLAR